MPDHRTLRLQELAEILKIGEKTLNVWRHRYKQWIPQPIDDGADLYPAESLPVFRFISKCTNAAMEPDEIERALGGMGNIPKGQEPAPEAGREKPAIDTGGLAHIFRDVVSDIAKQQHRIADAHERRASAEERKAYALESRAEAELIKANALKDMVALIKNVSEKDSVSALMDKVRNIHAPSPEELGDFSLDMRVDVRPEQLEDLPELEEETSLDFPVEADEKVMPEPEPAAEPELPPDEPEPAVEPELPRDVDDLSQLLDVPLPDMSPPDDIPMDIDDLSALLDPDDAPARETAPAQVQDIDDLSMLIDGDASVTETTASPDNGAKDVDDLSMLLDPEDTPSPKAPAPQAPAPSPAEDKEDYKSKILKRIIHMKQKENLSVEETTSRFNAEGVKTLSGKGEWDQKTIQGIYKYIDSVQGN